MKKHIKQRARTGSSVLSIASLALTGITTIIGLILSSSIVSATNDSVVDQVNITVPVSCTMTGTGMDSHSTEIENGLYENNIGTTTLHAFCNDNEGFAIYAAGYTGNEIGETNSNKLVGTNASSNATIVSGIATTAGNPDISNWAMKLAISQDSGDTTTNAFTIDSAPNVDLPSEAEQSAAQASFSQYHVVPNEYTKVAHKNSMTDMTASTGGVKLTTTYAAYISKTQPADTYTGQVIYTLVHPADGNPPVAPGKVGVNYHANGSTFSNNATENQVVYNSSPMYIATTPLISKTENIDNQGNQNGSYPVTTDEPTTVPVTATGAEKMKVVVRYGFNENTGALVVQGDWNPSQSTPSNFELISDGSSAVAGTSTYVFDGDAVTFYFYAPEAPVVTDGYDYGYFAEIYPIYATEQTGTESTSEFTTFASDEGTYAQTADWNTASAWYIEYNGTNKSFDNEIELKRFISKHSSELSGVMIDAYKNTYTQMLSSKSDFVVHQKIAALVPYDTQEEYDEAVKAIKMANALPSGFTATVDNTLSDENSVYPLYAWHEYVDSVGILFFYTPADKVRLGEFERGLFMQFPSLTDISGLSDWDTGRTKSMHGYFAYDESLADLSPLSTWDTGNVGQMHITFFDNRSLVDLTPLSNWDTGSVGDMSSMFAGDNALMNLSGLSNWNTGNVTNMSAMFGECTSLIDASAINGWEIRNVTSFNQMFYGAPSHPNFTKRSGTWNSSGTFVPSA